LRYPSAFCLRTGRPVGTSHGIFGSFQRLWQWSSVRAWPEGHSRAPGFASPGTFPSRRFSRPQGFAPPQLLQPYFMRAAARRISNHRFWRKMCRHQGTQHMRTLTPCPTSAEPTEARPPPTHRSARTLTKRRFRLLHPREDAPHRIGCVHLHRRRSGSRGRARGEEPGLLHRVTRGTHREAGEPVFERHKRRVHENPAGAMSPRPRSLRHRSAQLPRTRYLLSRSGLGTDTQPECPRPLKPDHRGEPTPRGKTRSSLSQPTRSCAQTHTSPTPKGAFEARTTCPEG